MDTVYGTKKYFQSLSGVGSDIYRTSTCRAVTNDYSSYQNTLGRRSVLASYSHMPTTKHPSYLTDFSLSSSQYGYNTWGVWRDSRNLSPSTYSSKSRQSVKSFSIILTTAAFIVVLAVLSIGGLAFYFSTFKTNNEDSVMAFQGSFRVSKGDIYTTGLKYNHTSTYKQKVDFYKRFIERSLMDYSFQPVRTDVLDFGDGPLINVAFRVFLDIRTLPRNIPSMEERIRESILMETTSMKSLYKSLKIESESIIIKRIMDEEVVKSASFSKDTTPSQSQTHFEKRLTKKNGSVEKSIPKISSTPKSKIKSNDDEPDIDVENAPVIQGSFEGSFEITKTDADITRKRTTPTKSVSTSATPFPTKFKSKKPTIEKVIPFIQKTFESAPTTTIASYTTPSMQTTPTTTSTTTTTTTTESLPEISTASSSIISSSTENVYSAIPSTSFYPPPLHESFLRLSNDQNPPKLDTNLFTNPPVMDTEPWRPIRPESMMAPKINMKQPSFGVSPTLFDAFETGLLPRNKFKITDHITKNPNEMMFYHSFTNPVFMPGTSGIEKLGSADVKPHPLPVPLIDEAMIPPFKPLNFTIHSETQQPINISSDIGEKFEHIGGGVIVKKHEETTIMPSANITNAVQIKFTAIKHITNTTDVTTPPTSFEKSTQSIMSEITTKLSQAISSTELGEMLENKTDKDTEEFSMTDKLANFLLDLLDVPKEKNETQNSKVESRIESEEKEKPNFLNIKEIVLNRNKNSNATKDDEKSQNLVRPSTGIPKRTTASTIPITTKFSLFSITEKPTTSRTTISHRKGSTKPKPKPTTYILDSTRTTPLTLDDSLLFPSHSKWEYVNGSSSGFISTKPMKKVFNETLQAWVVENDEKRENHTIKDIPVKRNHTFELQNISMIFDTLVSKLGISPTMPTKIPPFAALSQNKLKIRNKPKNQTTTVRTTTIRTTKSSSISTTSTTTTTNAPITSRSTESLMNQQSIENMSPEIIIGEAEIEVVDPTKYEEMLSSSVSLQSSTISKISSSTTTIHPPTLVTLMPVRSNSGIRTFRPPPIKSSNGGKNESSGSNESRRFVYHPKYRETVVKTGIQVTS